MLDKIVIIKKATGLEELLRRHTTTSQVKFYLESRGESYDYYKEAHDDYIKGLEETIASVPKEYRLQLIDKDNLATFQFSDRDVIVSVGGAGMLVNVAKYVGTQPVISVNPDTERFDSVLSSCTPEEFPAFLKKVGDGKAKTEPLTMAEARLEDGQVLYALNDFFIGRSDHVSARYLLKYDGDEERQSSSGVIVSTGTGSTGWMTSVVKGAYKIASANYEMEDVEEEEPIDIPFSRSAEHLLFAVREPFPSRSSSADIVYGRVTKENPLEITSNMPEKGVIFSDGVLEDYLEFTAGKTVTVFPSEKKVNLVRR